MPFPFAVSRCFVYMRVPWGNPAFTAARLAICIFSVHVIHNNHLYNCQVNIESIQFVSSITALHHAARQPEPHERSHSPGSGRGWRDELGDCIGNQAIWPGQFVRRCEIPIGDEWVGMTSSGTPAASSPDRCAAHRMNDRFACLVQPLLVRLASANGIAHA